jgi:hypothetical protein
MANNSNLAVIGARYSAINAMHQCRLWCYNTYRLKLPGYKNKFAKLGTVLHDVLEEYGKYCIKNKVDTDYTEFDKIKYKYLNVLQEDQIAEALLILDNIKTNFNWSALKEFELIDIEARYAIDKDLNITEDPNPYLSGGVDLFYADGDIGYVDDYKSVRTIYTKGYMSKSLQRKIYSLLLLMKYPELNVIKFRFNFIRYGFISDYFDIYREELDTLAPMIVEEIEALNNLLSQENPPEPSAGGHCILCESRATCPAYKNAFAKIEQINTEEDAVKLFGAYKLASIRIKNMEEILKLWIDNNSPIKFKDEQYGPQSYDKIEFEDTLKLIDILKEAEVPEGAIFEQLNMSNTKVKKIVKKFKLSEDIQKKIAKIATNSQYTKFNSIKLTEEDVEELEEEIQDQLVDQYL